MPNHAILLKNNGEYVIAVSSAITDIKKYAISKFCFYRNRIAEFVNHCALFVVENCGDENDGGYSGNCFWVHSSKGFASGTTAPPEMIMEFNRSTSA